MKTYLKVTTHAVATLLVSGSLLLAQQPTPQERVVALKAGDSFALDVDLAGNRPVEAKVSTYLESREDAVTLDVKFSTLDNSATYASRTTLNAPTKNLSVNVENSGYRRQ